MPWNPPDAARHDKKADTPVKKRQWAHVANSVLGRGGSESSAIRQANGVIKKRRVAPGGLGAALSAAGRRNKRPLDRKRK